MIIYGTTCQKEFHDISQPPSGGDNQPTNTSQDSIYIERIARTKLNGSGGYDTIVLTSFFYDSQRRLIGWRDYPVSNADYLERFEFIYAGTDTLPFEGRSTHKDVASPDSTVQQYFFFYDSNARKIKDSIIKTTSNSAIIGGWVDQFYYLPGKSITVGKYQEPGVEYYYKDTATLDANNNIVSVNFYSDAGYEYLYSVTFQFDDKVHPYSKMNILNAIPKNIGGGFSHKYAERNNIIYQKIEIPSINYVEEINNSIVYNGFYMPKIIDRLASNGTTNRLFLFYRGF